MLFRLIPYVLILVMAAGACVGAYWAGDKAGEARAVAEQWKADMKQASVDADRLAEWEDFNAKLNQEAAQTDDQNLIQLRKTDAAIRLSARGNLCGGVEWLRLVDGLK